MEKYQSETDPLDPKEEAERFPKGQGDITKEYRAYFTALEKHPNYKERQNLTIPGSGLTLRGFVEYCKLNAKEDYTNDNDEDYSRFQKFRDLLN